MERFDIGDSGQQVHIAFGTNDLKSSRHPCFKIQSPDALLQLRQRVWEHHQRGNESAPQEADKPGAENSGKSKLLIDCGLALAKACEGAKGAEYPQRFFARDYAGNRLEFSI